MRKEYNSSLLEEEFRDGVLELLMGAKKEVLVITGEFHVFEKFQDLKWAIKETIDRGVKFRIIASSPSPSTINKLLVWGAEIYIISQEDLSKEHCLIIDRRDVMTSSPHAPNRIGVREGYIDFKSEKAKEKAKVWDTLAKKGKRILKPNWEQDPIFQLVDNPMDFGIVTNANIL